MSGNADTEAIIALSNMTEKERIKFMSKVVGMSENDYEARQNFISETLKEFSKKGCKFEKDG